MSTLPTSTELLPSTAKGPLPFAMYVKLPMEVLQAIKHSNGSGVKLCLGPKMVSTQFTFPINNIFSGFPHILPRFIIIILTSQTT